MDVDTSSESSLHGCWSGRLKKMKESLKDPPPLELNFHRRNYVWLDTYNSLEWWMESVKATKDGQSVDIGDAIGPSRHQPTATKGEQPHPTHFSQHNHPKCVAEARETICSKCGQ